MSERQPYLGESGTSGGMGPVAARRLLGWFEDLVGCSQEEIARRAGLTSRRLRYFVAGGGGPRTIARLAAAVPVPLWVVHETMMPTVAAVNEVWWNGRGKRAGGAGVFGEARDGAMALASKIAVVAFLARRGGAIEGIIRPGRRRHWAGLHPVDARVLIRWLQSLGGGTRKDFATAAGLSHEALRMYEAGEWPLEMPALGLNLGEGAGLPLWLVEGVMLPAITAVRLVSEHAGRRVLLAGWVGALAAAPAQIHSQQTDWAAGLLLPPVGQGSVSTGPSAADRIGAEDLWRRLEGRSPAERVRLVKNCREFHSWALSERLCLESERAAPDSAKVALGVARLALRVARLVQGEEFFGLQLEGFAFLYIGNSHRVAGAMRAAEATFSRGVTLWRAGAGTRHTLLQVWRVLDLEASLLRSQRRFDEALERIARALSAAPREERGRILIKRATVLDQKMEPEASIAVLWEAAPLIDAKRDGRLSFLWTAMLGVNYCHLERYREAKDLLPRAQALAAELRRFLDTLRLEWLRGRIEAGLGHREEALSALTWVQGELDNQKIAYDYALVSLEIGEILLGQGRFAEVQDLALKMEWIFKREEIHVEAAKALDLFRRAAEGEKATPELVRSVVRYLYRAQYNPELKFAA